MQNPTIRELHTDFQYWTSAVQDFISAPHDKCSQESIRPFHGLIASHASFDDSKMIRRHGRCGKHRLANFLCVLFWCIDWAHSQTDVAHIDSADDSAMPSAAKTEDSQKSRALHANNCLSLSSRHNIQSTFSLRLRYQETYIFCTLPQRFLTVRRRAAADTKIIKSEFASCYTNCYLRTHDTDDIYDTPTSVIYTASDRLLKGAI